MKISNPIPEPINFYNKQGWSKDTNSKENNVKLLVVLFQSLTISFFIVNLVDFLSTVLYLLYLSLLFPLSFYLKTTNFY
jgi:hypothetical protein